MAKIKIEQIIQEATDNNWKLVSQEYKNLDTPLEFICPEGHQVIIPYGKWRGSHICPICDKPRIEMSDEIVPKKKGQQRILALDQATKTTGWAIADDDKIIKYGIVSFYGEGAERINKVKNWLINILQIWRPDVVFLEDIQLQEKKINAYENDDGDHVIGVTTYKVLAQLQGVLLDLLYEQKIPAKLVHTAVWRKSCQINGKFRTDKKRSAQLKVKEWFDIDVSNDEADAICIARYGFKHEKVNNEMIEW